QIARGSHRGPASSCVAGAGGLGCAWPAPRRILRRRILGVGAWTGRALAPLRSEKSSFSGVAVVRWFFALVFALAVPFWVAGAFTGRLPGAPMDLPLAALMFPAPLVAALVLVR